MSTSLHSKAPWTDNEGSIETATGAVVAYVYGPGEWPGLDASDYQTVEAECVANRKLVQHAPEVLAQLQYAVFLFSNGIAPNSDCIAGMLSAIALAGVEDLHIQGADVADKTRVLIAVPALCDVVRFALNKFCSPHDLETDPASKRLKELGEAALARLEGGVA